MIKEIKYFFLKVSQLDLLTQAAALALYTAFSLAPLMILLLSILATLKLEFQMELLTHIEYLVGSEAAQMLNIIITKSEARADLSSFAGWVGTFTLFFSASAIFGHLQSTMNLIFTAKPSAKPIQKWHQKVKKRMMRRLISFGMVLTFIFISIVSLVVSSLLSLFLPNDLDIWGTLVQSAANLVVFALLFGAIFKWMPDEEIEKQAIFKGSIITAILFILGKTLIGVYLGQAAVGSAYGAAGSLIVLLVWVYYSSLIIFLGAEITAQLNRGF